MGVLFTTSLLTLAVMSATLFIYPLWLDSSLLEDLAGDDALVRQQAVEQAGFRAKIRPEFKDKLIAALDTEDDTHFFAVVTALNKAETFRASVKNQLYIDRAAAMEFASAQNADTQFWLLSQVVTNRSSSLYIHRIAKIAASRPDFRVRRAAAMLAAKLKNDSVLGPLLDDETATVRAAAALNAGVAGISALSDTLVEKLGDPDANVAGSAAMGLAYMDAEKYGPKLCDLLARTDNAKLRRRLCAVMTVLNNDLAREAIDKLLTSTRGKSPPDIMAILAAGKLGVKNAAEDVRGVLAAAAKDPKTDRSLVHAAIEAATTMNVPVRGDLYNICRKYWNPDWQTELLFASAAHLLGRQAADDKGQTADAATRAECEKLLIKAAGYARRQTTTAPTETIPMASAAAATAFWLLNPSSDLDIQIKETVTDGGVIEFTGRTGGSARLIMDAATSSILAGDSIAWRLARSERPEAFKLALKMLPARNAPLGQRVYNENLRGAGAMLLALSARTDEQKKIAIQRINERFEPGDDHSGEDDPVLAGRYRCALLTLGVKKHLQTVRNQRNNSEHAVAAAFTALMLTGDPDTLDYLFYNNDIDPADIATFLIYDNLHRVTAFALPKLPAIDPAAPDDIRVWQAKIMRAWYVLHRDELSLGPKQ